MKLFPILTQAFGTRLRKPRQHRCQYPLSIAALLIPVGNWVSAEAEIEGNIRAACIAGGGASIHIRSKPGGTAAAAGTRVWRATLKGILDRKPLGAELPPESPASTAARGGLPQSALARLSYYSWRGNEKSHDEGYSRRECTMLTTSMRVVTR